MRLELQSETSTRLSHSGSRLVCREGTFWWVHEGGDEVLKESGESYPYLPEAYDYSVVPLGELGIAFEESSPGYRVQSLSDRLKAPKHSGDRPVFSPGGQLVSLNTKNASYKPVISVKSVVTGETILELEGGNSPRFSADGKWIIARVWIDNCNSNSGTWFHIGNLRTGQCHQIIMETVVNGECWILDDKRVVALDKNRQLLCYPLSSGIVSRPTESKPTEFRCLHGVRDGIVIPSGGARPGAWIDFESMETLFEKPNTLCFAFSPIPNWAARIAEDRPAGPNMLFLEVFHTRTGTPSFQQSIRGALGEEPPQLVFSEDGQRLAYLDQESFRTWSCKAVSSGKVFELVKLPETLEQSLHPPESWQREPPPGPSSVLDKSGRASVFKIGSFLFNSAKSLVEKFAGTTDPSEESSAVSYPPIVGFEHRAPRNPAESIDRLKFRLNELESTVTEKVPEHSSEALGLAKNLIELRNLKTYWERVEKGHPPFSLTAREEYLFRLAETNYLRLIEKDLEAQVELFGFLELLSRGNPPLRAKVGYLFSRRLKPYQDYLARSIPREEPGPEVPGLTSVEVEAAIQDWILPMLRSGPGLTDGEFTLVRDKLTADLSVVKIKLESIGPRTPVEKYQSQVVSSLLRSKIVDPDNPTPEAIIQKLESFYDLELQFEYCKRCMKPQKSSWMKTSTICWGCWDG